MSLRLLAFAASLRKASLNRRLITAAVAMARTGGAEVDLADFREFDMPLFDADLMAREGLPAGAEALRRRLEPADGLLLASPEYNYSLPGTLKNAIDWISRIRPVPFKGKSALLLSTSNGGFGGIRGLWQLRIPLEGLGVFVHPGMFALAWGDKALGPDGTVEDAAARDRLAGLMGEYLRAAQALALR